MILKSGWGFAGEGFDKFVETVEYSLGAEDPEEFAKREYNEIQQQQMEAAKRGMTLALTSFLRICLTLNWIALILIGCMLYTLSLM